MEILFQSYNAYSRYIVRYNSLTSQEALAVVQSHPPSPPPPATPPHQPREKKMRLWERECCTSHEAREDGDKRYRGNGVDLEHDDYDVMRCSMRNYYFTSVWVFFSGSGADSVLCSLFGVLYFRLEIYLSVSGFEFSILLVCIFF